MSVWYQLGFRRPRIAAALGFLAAPIPAALIGALGTFIGPSWPDPVFGLIGYMIGFIIALFFGLPMFLLGKYLDLVRWWTAVIAGFLIGIVVEIATGWNLITDIDDLPDGITVSDVLMPLFIYGIGGACSGFLFWLVLTLVGGAPKTQR